MIGTGEQTEQEVKYSLVLLNIADRHGLTSPTTVALAYILHQAPYVFLIIRGRKIEVCDLYVPPLYLHHVSRRCDGTQGLGGRSWDTGACLGVAANIVQHLHENIKAITLKLSEAEIKEIGGR